MDVPAPIPTMQIPNMQFKRVAGLFDQDFITEASSIRPLHYEYYAQNQGMGIYESALPVGPGGILKFTNLADYGQVYLNGKFIGNISRSHTSDFSIEMPEVTAPGKLEVLVESMGHRNVGNGIENDYKGLYDKVLFNGEPVSDWVLRRLPLEKLNVIEKDEQPERHGGIFKVEIELNDTADVYIDATNYFKGYIYVNGYNLGRYWNIGPQYRLYCPGIWLNKGINTIYFLELETQAEMPVTGFEYVSGCPEG